MLPTGLLPAGLLRQPLAVAVVASKAGAEALGFLADKLLKRTDARFSTLQDGVRIKTRRRTLR